MIFFIKTIFALFLLTFASCSPKSYKDKSFFSKEQQETQALAVLPVEVIFTGNLPKKWDLDRVAKMELEESILIQETIYNDFLFHTKINVPNKWGVSLMDFRFINNRLEEKGISIRDSWKLSSAELSQVLGVDMLIRTKVQKERIMSKAAAIGINVGLSVISDVLSNSGTSSGAPETKANENEMSISFYHSSKREAIARV